jgi:hypothetical protein
MIALVLAAGCCARDTQPKKVDQKKTPEATGNEKVPPAGPSTSLKPGVYLINKDYNRISSRILIRRVVEPTLSKMDFAAYDSNSVLFDPSDYKPKPPEREVTLKDLDFKGALVKETLCDHLSETPLTEQEKDAVMAWRPVSEYLTLWNYDVSVKLAEAGGAVSGDKWNDENVIPPYQEISRVWLHKTNAGYEMWVKVDIAPWVKFIKGVDDEDNDSFPEFYAKLKPEAINEQVVQRLKEDYLTRILTLDEVNQWVYDLVTPWYPVYMTYMLKPEPVNGGGAPDPATLEADKELLSAIKGEPTVLLQSAPFQKTIYLVLFVDGMKGK